jgi:hypothetical protein
MRTSQRHFYVSAHLPHNLHRLLQIPFGIDLRDVDRCVPQDDLGGNAFVRESLRGDLDEGGLFPGGATRELIESLNSMIENDRPRNVIIATLAKSQLAIVAEWGQGLADGTRG